MEGICLLRRPLSKLQSALRICAKSFSTTTTRHEASYRRSRSRLNVKPDASFLPSKTEPHDHVIFNPPPSAPNIFHTPTIFLPKSDRRRQLHDAARARRGEPAIADATSQMALPPGTGGYGQKRYHITAEQMEEMRELKRSDPAKWSSHQLSKKFDCSARFVAYVTENIGLKEKERQKQVLEVVKSRWGVRRRTAREDRQIRKEKWFSDS